MTHRQTLPNRRTHHAFSFAHEGIEYRCGAGFFEDGALAEIFLSCAKPGCAAETAARDAAIAVSIGLQYGMPLAVIQHAVTRTDDGGAAGPLGHALDLIDAAQYG